MAISVSQAFKDAFKGPVDRTMIKVEVYFSAGLGWVDVTPWVESLSGSQEELSALTRGTSANTLSVVLNNDDGRFSRKNTAGPYYASGLGLVPNKPIRVSAVFGSESVRLFTGYTGPWNTNAKARTCSVSAQDAARLLRDHEVTPEILMDPASPSQGYYLTRIIERAAWLAGLRWDAVTTRSADWTSTAHGGAITPTYDGAAVRAVYTQGGALVMTLDLVDLRIPVAELKGHALELISKLAQVVDGTVYFDAQGQLVFRARMYLNDSAVSLAETFTVSSLEDVTAQANFEASQFAPLINKATVTSKPLAPVLDAAGNWTEQEIVVTSFVKSEFDTAEKYPDSGDPDLFVAFPDGIRIHREPGYPSAANVTVSSSYSDDTTRELNGIGFTDGTPVFFPEAVKVVFVNNGTGKERLKEMRIRVKHFKAIEGCRGVAENADSQDLYGMRAKEIDNDFIPSVDACKQLAAWIVEDGREVKDQLTLPIMYGLPWLEINDRIKVSETISRTIPTEEEFIVKRIPWSWTLGAFMFAIEACTPSPNFSVSSLPSTAMITETANVNLSAAVKGGLPPQAIDGTQRIIGLNNIPGLDSIVSGTPRSYTYSGMSLRQVAYGAGSLWVGGSGMLGKIDPLNAVLDGSYTISDGPITNEITDAAFANDLGWFLTSASPDFGGVGHSLWSLNSSHAGVRKYNTPTKRLDSLVVAKVSGSDNLWCLQITTSSDLVELLRWTDLSQSAGSPANTYTIDSAADSVNPTRGAVATANAIWVLTVDGSQVMKLTRFDLDSLTSEVVLTTSMTQNLLRCITTDGQFLYILEGDCKKVSKYAISGKSVVKVSETTSLPGGATAYSVHFDGRMLICPNSGTAGIARIDPSTGLIVALYTVPGLVTNARVVNDGSSIWTCGGALRRLPIVQMGRY